MGLAETHQTLVLNGLRSRVALQVDGGLRTGRDVIIGALLGADEFGFSTAPLIAAGCIMMRKCHLNTCPVGVATQDPVLRKRFKGTPEHVINFFFYVAEEVRQLLADMGYSRLDEIIGQSDLLAKEEMVAHWKAQRARFLQDLLQARCPGRGDALDRAPEAPDRRRARPQADRGGARPRWRRASRSASRCRIRNVDRSAGAMLSGEVAKRFRHKGLREDTIQVKLTGTAGQSFGAFLARGISFELVGDGNDYVGKGLSGGRIVIRPPEDGRIVAEESIIVGNTVLYGATEGECYFRGVAGERFAVRNSGRACGRRRRRRPWLRIHDRRRRRRHRPDRAATSPPACRAASPMCSTRKATSPNAATWRWSSSSRCRRGRHAGEAAPSWRRHRPQGPRRRLGRHDQP